LDGEGKRRDVDQRPELSSAVVEWIAPSEYMVRPPQAPTYFFVIDVGASAIRSGMLGGVASAISKSLDDLPGGSRTKVGFVTFDTAVHYYSLRPGSDKAQMMVVADLDELFVPAPDHLLSDLRDCREAVDHFLENLPTMFREEDAPEDSCLGPALKAAFTIVKSIGGRMSIFQAAPPSLGEGAIRMGREAGHGRILGTADESNLLKAEVNWYRDTALEFSKAQIAVDMYMFPERHIDCASLVELPRLTAGFVRSFPRFDARIGSGDVEALETTLYRRLTQPTAFEAVLRIRCTKGMRISRFYGNFNIRGTDLLALPNCNADSVFGFELAHDDPNMAGAGETGGGGGLTSNSFVTIQSALLYTTDNGERRIRVSTQALRLTSRPAEILASANEACVATLLAKQVMSHGLKSNLDVARNRLIQSCVDVVRCSKEAGMTSGGSGDNGAGSEVVVPDSLRLLPLYVLSLLKHAAVRGGTDVHPDERVCARALLTDAYVSETIRLIHPRMFAVHDIDQLDNAQVGLPTEMTIGEDGEEKFVDDDDEWSVAGRERIRLPRTVGLSVESLSSEGIYVLDNGLETYVWVGRASDPACTIALFGVDSLEHANMMEIQLQTQGNDTATRLSTILQALHEGNQEQPGLPPTSSKIIIVREGDMQMESRFFWNLVEDRAQFNGGTYTYPEFMQAVSQPGGGGGGMPPGGMHPGGMPPGRGMMPPNGVGGMMPPNGVGGMPPPGGGMAPPGPPGGGMQRGYTAPPPPNNLPSYPPARGGPPPPGGGPPGYNAPPPPQPSNPGGAPPPPGRGGPPPPPGGVGGGMQQVRQYSTGSNSGIGGMPPPPSAMDRSAPPPPGGGPSGPPSGGYNAAPPSGGGYNTAPPSGGGGGGYNNAGAPPSGGGGYNPSMSMSSTSATYNSQLPPSSSSAPPSSGGYNPSSGGPPSSSGSFPPPPPGSGGGVGGRGPPPPPPSSGGYGGPPSPGPPPPNSGGYVPGPPPNSGGYVPGPPPNSGGYVPGPPPNSGGFNMQGGNGMMAPPGGPPPPPSSGGYGGPPPPGQYYNR